MTSRRRLGAIDTDSSMPGDERLTAFARGAGCGCKLSSAELQASLQAMTLAMPSGPEVLVGPDSGDDAGVFEIAPDLALVQTLDFFTPIVDDAFTWGRIAATNALSDVYAMGGKPLTAMNIVCWPRDRLPWALLGEVLDGAATVLADAGCALVGGHSIDDTEPKYGLSVTGVVHPASLLTNAAAESGDSVAITKPLGTGAIATATKMGLAEPAHLDESIGWMTTSNGPASAAAVGAGVRCATDVTGFGLVGHLLEVSRASDVVIELDLGSIPTMDGVRDLIGFGAVASGTSRNRDDARAVDWASVSRVDQLVLCDAQTSGGLLVTAPLEAIDSMADSGVGVWTIGRVLPRSAGHDEPLVRFTCAA